MTNWINLILRKDLLIAFRRSSTYITPLIFFLIVITFFPLALGPNQNLLSSLAPGIIWIAALLASLQTRNVGTCEESAKGSEK